VSDVIDGLLHRIWVEHYAPDRVREFARDRVELTRALARYGHACESRGWYFEESAIFGELGRLIESFRDKRAVIEYLPSYLRGAIDRHIGMQAERLSDEAKTAAAAIERFRRRHMQQQPAMVVVEPKPVEQLAQLYRDLSRRSRQRRTIRTEESHNRKAQLQLI